MTTPSLRERVAKIMASGCNQGPCESCINACLQDADQIISLFVEEAEGMKEEHQRYCVVLTRQFEKDNCSCGVMYRNQALDDLIKRLRGK